MKQVDQWWFPDEELMLPAEMTKHQVYVDGRLTWQYHKYEAAMKCCRKRRVAIDIGAHVGLWSYFMARDFDYVHAFEPLVDHRACWARNLEGTPPERVALYGMALGAANEIVHMTSDPTATGGAHIGDGPHAVQVWALDDFGIAIVDLIKIDVEGYEAAVIRGAVQTLLRCRPVVIVENVERNLERYGESPASVINQLTDLGMQVQTRLGPDTILTWA